MSKEYRCEKHNQMYLLMCIKCLKGLKGENKKNPWTNRPLTDEDKEHYGQVGESK